jgi:hypothetical protein
MGRYVSALLTLYIRLYEINLGIQDPVNEINIIGRQTFSIRDIQQEWELSLNALNVVMDTFEKGDVQASILGSIVGLTTRQFISRNF